MHAHLILRLALIVVGNAKERDIGSQKARQRGVAQPVADDGVQVYANLGSGGIEIVRGEVAA